MHLFCKSDAAPVFRGAAPFNKISGRVRWLVHEIRRLCPERKFGTRSIAMRLIRAGVQLSRASVQRILREKPPKPPTPRLLNSEQSVPHTILRPAAINRTWHL